MPEHRITLHQEFLKPVDEVFGYLADHHNLATIFGIPVKRVKDGEGDPNGVGSVRQLGMKPLAIEETVRLVVPNETIEYAITKGGGPVTAHYGKQRFEAIDGGTRLHWEIRFYAPRVVGAVVAKTLDVALTRGLRGAKRLSPTR